MSGVEGAEREDYDDGEAGVVISFRKLRLNSAFLRQAMLALGVLMRLRVCLPGLALGLGVARRSAGQSQPEYPVR